jgi:hypothetical protein
MEVSWGEVYKKVCLSRFYTIYASPRSSGNTGKGLFHIIIKLLAQIGQDLSSGTGAAIMAV